MIQFVHLRLTNRFFLLHCTLEIINNTLVLSTPCASDRPREGLRRARVVLVARTCESTVPAPASRCSAHHGARNNSTAAQYWSTAETFFLFRNTACLCRNIFSTDGDEREWNSVFSLPDCRNIFSANTPGSCDPDRKDESHPEPWPRMLMLDREDEAKWDGGFSSAQSQRNRCQHTRICRSKLFGARVCAHALLVGYRA
jgi:hypothetical protein